MIEDNDEVAKLGEGEGGEGGEGGGGMMGGSAAEGLDAAVGSPLQLLQERVLSFSNGAVLPKLLGTLATARSPEPPAIAAL